MKMKSRTRKKLAPAVAAAIITVCIGATYVWVNGQNNLSPLYGKTVSNQSETSPKDMTKEDIKKLRAEIGRLKEGIRDLKKSSLEMNSSMLEQNRTLDAAITSAEQGSSYIVPPEWNESAPDLSPEEEIEMADAQMQTHVELIEETIFIEETDPEWSYEAELALDEAYRNEDMERVELANIECRSTLCRIELLFDETSSPEEVFRNFPHITPWEGEGFIKINDGENAQAVVYLAREGYSLPQHME
jgi:hypothetical protein